MRPNVPKLLAAVCVPEANGPIDFRSSSMCAAEVWSIDWSNTAHSFLSSKAIDDDGGEDKVELPNLVDYNSAAVLKIDSRIFMPCLPDR